ncbi:MAG: three-Cys-motif partner protein TcmP [Gemmatimonadaceae bacterium]
MSVPTETIWTLEPHSLGKHIVLRRYLKAWLPILGTTQGRIVFIDGFAGPGQYAHGEQGSPIIALDAFENHHAPITAHVAFWFIEAQADRAEHLEKLVAPYRERLRDRARISVSHATFDESLSELLSEIGADNKILAPSFVMVDPFGVSQTPMTVIREILKNPKSEVYISFMAEWVNRFLSAPEFEPGLDSLFGCSDWRKARKIQGFHDRKTFLFDLYKNCLREAGAKYVVHFELYRGAQLVYAIFFGTGSDVGCDKMKEAIWKADPEGGASFVSGADAALNLFTHDVSRFEVEIVAGLSKRRNEWVSIERLQKWARSDKTHYHSGQLKTAMARLEKSGTIEARHPSGKRRRNTYPPKTEIKAAQLASD